MLALVSISDAFPKVYIVVSVDGTAYDEMHVDGVASHSSFSHSC